VRATIQYPDEATVAAASRLPTPPCDYDIIMIVIIGRLIDIIVGSISLWQQQN
jgi:hypothetical protein